MQPLPWRGRVADAPCQTCRGDGRAQKRKKLRVTIRQASTRGIRSASPAKASGAAGRPTGQSVRGGARHAACHLRREERRSTTTCSSPSPRPRLDAAGYPRSRRGGNGDPAGTQPGTEIRLRGRVCRTCAGLGRAAISTSSSTSRPTKLSRRQRQLLEELAAESGERCCGRQHHRSDEGCPRLEGGVAAPAATRRTRRPRVRQESRSISRRSGRRLGRAFGRRRHRSSRSGQRNLTRFARAGPASSRLRADQRGTRRRRRSEQPAIVRAYLPGLDPRACGRRSRKRRPRSATCRPSAAAIGELTTRMVRESDWARRGRATSRCCGLGAGGHPATWRRHRGSPATWSCRSTGNGVRDGPSSDHPLCSRRSRPSPTRAAWQAAEAASSTSAAAPDPRDRRRQARGARPAGRRHRSIA